MAYRGIYKPKNLHKYKGDHTKIRYLSLWELKAFKWCDSNQHILKWSSEEVIIPYRCDTDGKMHRYYMDLWIKLDVTDDLGNDEMLIEIKPHDQHCPKCFNKLPCKYGRKTKSYAKPRKTKRLIMETKRWTKNQSKWRATRKYCSDRGWSFKILDEYGLGIKKPRAK